MSAPSEVLVVGENRFPFHRLEGKESQFRSILDSQFEVTVTTELDALTGLPESDYAVVIDYLTDSTLSEKQRRGLLAFVDNGGGYVPVHCGSDLTSIADGSGGIDQRDEPPAELRELIGGRFVTHPDQTEFGIELTSEHPITEGVSDFSVLDEPYEVEWDDDVTVLARMEHPDLRSYPVLWTKAYGAGRVCYLSLGHTDAAFEEPGFRALLRNAVEWATGR